MVLSGGCASVHPFLCKKGEKRGVLGQKMEKNGGFLINNVYLCSEYYCFHRNYY